MIPLRCCTPGLVSVERCTKRHLRRSFFSDCYGATHITTHAAKERMLAKMSAEIASSPATVEREATSQGKDNQAFSCPTAAYRHGQPLPSLILDVQV